MFLRLATTALAFAFCLATGLAQTCTPAGMPIGQPGLIGFAPSCVGAIPLSALPGGNPGFAISAAVLPVPPSFVFLLFSGFAPPPFVPLPPGLLCGSFGLPGTIPAVSLGAFYVGLSAPTPPPPFPLPIPPGFAPGTLFLTVQTAAYNPALSCVALSNGITITN